MKWLKFKIAITTLLMPVLFTAVRSADAGSESDEAPIFKRTFVYTITNPNGPNAIAAYEANPETGELVFLGTYPTGGLGTGRLVDSQSPLVVNEEGTFLFAVNPGSDDISVMSIEGDGSLELVNRPVPSRGVGPASLAHKNNLLYVANKGDSVNPPSYAGFRVESDGALARLSRKVNLAVGDNPTHILFTADGRRLIGLRFGSGGLDCFAVRSNGKLRFVSRLNNQPGPFAGAFNPVDGNQLMVADARVPGASSYLVSDEGALSAITTVSNTPERAACWIVAHADGQRVWVSNTGTNSLSLYRVGEGGGLTLVSTHSTLAFGRTPFEIALDGSGRFLYQLNIGAANQSIHALRVTESGEGAGLSDIGAIGLPAGSSPIGLVVTAR
jgi:6-phosphogluconolactonase (cycloisomerase 2 family)